MWSIGCVFSEVAVWAHYGWKRVDEYRRQRSAEIEAKGDAVGEHSFHFDGDLLDAVNNIHQDMLEKTTVNHMITRLVLDHLVLNLLQHESRPYAKLVFEGSKRLVKECEKRLGISVTELGRSANGELMGSDEARTRTRGSQQVPHEHRRSAGRNSPLEEPPPDDGSTPPSSSSSSQSSPHRHHHKSASQSSKRRNIRAIESSQSNGQASLVVPNPPPPPPIAANSHGSPPQQHVLEPQEGPVRPTLSIDQGHAWKEEKKNGGNAILRGGENLTSLDKRDHVSHVPSKLNLANR